MDRKSAMQPWPISYVNKSKLFDFEHMSVEHKLAAKPFYRRHLYTSVKETLLGERGITKGQTPHAGS